MSKYLYKTVYEEFTGLKPPEPKKEEKSERRRGLGHPYRMRLQQDKSQEPKKPQREQKKGASRCRNPYRLRQFHQQNSGDNYYRQPDEQPRQKRQPRQLSEAAQHQQQQQSHYQARPQQRLYEQTERRAKSAPKVMYKKRRQLELANEQEAVSA